MDWLIAHAFWVLGAAAIFVGLLFSLHKTLQALRLRASLLALALLTASLIFWPARLWVSHHPQLGTPEPTLAAIVTVALWLAIAAVPCAILGRPRLAPLIVIASVITFVFWTRTAVPQQASLWTVLHITRVERALVERAPSPANSPAKPTPALSKAAHP